jgi:hypothetical protein
VEHVAGIEDYELALATYQAAIKRWRGAPITLRQGARVIEDSRRLRVAWSDQGRQGGLRRSELRMEEDGTGDEKRAAVASGSKCETGRCQSPEDGWTPH